jgi:hypothetical protein
MFRRVILASGLTVASALAVPAAVAIASHPATAHDRAGGGGTGVYYHT